MDPKPDGRPLEVLVVDDGASNRRLSAALLESLGCRVATAATGRDGVAMALATRYDVILLDLHLPDIDGRAASEAIRRGQGASATRPSPIVALSTDTPTPDMVEFDAYLTKPATSDELERAISSVTSETVEPSAPNDAGLDLGAELVALARVDLAEMWDALGRRDYVAIQHEAHGLDRMSRSFGFPAVSSAAASIEQLAKAEAGREIEAWLCHLGALLERVSPRPHGAI